MDTTPFLNKEQWLNLHSEVPLATRPDFRQNLAVGVSIKIGLKSEMIVQTIIT